MSDCAAIYRKVKDFAKCLYPGEPRGFFRRNLNTLPSMIIGIIIGKETQLPQIANNDCGLFQSHDLSLFVQEFALERSAADHPIHAVPHR